MCERRRTTNSETWNVHDWNRNRFFSFTSHKMTSKLWQSKHAHRCTLEPTPQSFPQPHAPFSSYECLRTYSYVSIVLWHITLLFIKLNKIYKQDWPITYVMCATSYKLSKMSGSCYNVWNSSCNFIDLSSQVRKFIGVKTCNKAQCMALHFYHPYVAESGCWQKFI